MGLIVITSDHECEQCKTKHTVAVSQEEYDTWKAGAFIQDAMPTATADEREILLSGTCSRAWNKLFAEEECDSDCDGSKHPSM